MQTVLVEAEGFEQRGGWVVDQQFMDQMGSPYLLAHGIGKPVADAVTSVTFPAAGRYRAWVRTMDWVARWNATGTPGRFQLLIDRQPLPTTFGTEGADWHWQDGGIVEVGKQATLALHDVTGFEGRCDAILFCSDASFVPPNGGEDLATLREKLMGKLAVPENGGTYDLVVAGGGIAGICAALSASRQGLTVALVHDRPVLGGNNSPEVRVWLGGEIHQQPYPKIGNLVQELEPKAKEHYGPGNTAELYEPEERLALLKSEPALSLFLNQRVIKTEIRKDRIIALISQDISTGRRMRYESALFADCTGDGAVGFRAGADFEMTEKGHMGPSNLWNVKDTGKPVSFPRCPWAFDLTNKPFPGRGKEVGQYAEDVLSSLGVWFWENGFSRNAITDAEMIRDTNFRAMYGAWDALKNVDGMYPNHALNWSAHISGPRESRRLMGDVVLTRDDVMTGRRFEDACFPCTWTLDLHYPDPKYSGGFEGTEFISIAIHDRFAMPYWAPYRCLYSRNIRNLFMAGRDISVTHEALGTVRVMRTTGMMGEVVGMAASICKRRNCTPREVYARHLAELRTCLDNGVPGRKTGSKHE